MRLTLLLCALLATPAAAQPSALFAAIRADDWPRAATLAAAEPDPLAQKLVLYYRLLAPGAARAAEIAAFMAENPAWPQQALLSRRLQEALLTDRDDLTVAQICRDRPPSSIPSLLRCAETPQPGPTALDSARQAWIMGITEPAQELAFLRRWGTQIAPEDQWRRFDRLAWSEPPAPDGAPARQIPRLAPSHRPAAEARLALRRDAPTAAALAALLPEPARADPGLVLELARWYRRAGQERDAARVWTTAGPAAERAAPPERAGTFWAERNRLARELLRAAEPGLAYDVVASVPPRATDAIDQAFLAGWIALRRLQRPADALHHFQALATLSPAVITQARAHYWQGRALGNAPEASAAYTRAAAWPTTFYGQLAALALEPEPTALNARIAAHADPVWDLPRARDVLRQDCARAALLLTAFGEPRRARAFIARLDELATDPADHAIAAHIALGLDLPEQAVAIARRAGADGLMLPGIGWRAPFPSAEPPGEPVLLGVMRQESSFDVGAASPVGARGLMQLMPATATAVARKLGLPPDIPALTSDPAYNIRLGASYLQGLLDQFGALPLAIAGYNAGPNRVRDWLIGQDPFAGAEAMIDWIELIPFNETRNYVQRVIENIVLYRARAGLIAPNPIVTASAP